MFLHMLSIEIRKTLRHPALWMGLAALLFLFAMFLWISHLQVARGELAASGGLEEDLITGLALYNWIGVLVYAVTGSVIAAFDYPDRSIQLWLARGVTRPILLFARLTAILLFGLMIVCFTLAALLGLGALSRMFVFGTVEASQLNPSAFLPVILRVFWGGVPYLALTVLFAVISRSPLFAAGGTVVYGTVIEPLAPALGERFAWLIRYMPASLSQVLQTHNSILDRAATQFSPDAAGVPEPRAILVIGILFLFINIASLVIFSRQDVGG